MKLRDESVKVTPVSHTSVERPALPLIETNVVYINSTEDLIEHFGTPFSGEAAALDIRDFGSVEEVGLLGPSGCPMGEAGPVFPEHGSPWPIFEITSEAAQNLMELHGLDVEEELSEILIQEIERELTAEETESERKVLAELKIRIDKYLDHINGVSDRASDKELDDWTRLVENSIIVESTWNQPTGIDRGCDCSPELAAIQGTHIHLEGEEAPKERHLLIKKDGEKWIAIEQESDYVDSI